jgi:hypothetical protein
VVGRKWSGRRAVSGLTDHTFLADAVRAFGLLLPGAVRVFPVAERDQALAWAAA